MVAGKDAAGFRTLSYEDFQMKVLLIVILLLWIQHEVIAQ